MYLKAGFKAYLGEEDHLHKQVMDYIAWTYKNLGVIYWHTPNEGKRSAFGRFKLSWLGTRAGVSDILIVYNKKLLALELKSKGKKPTENQKLFLTDIKNNGFFAEWADNYDSAIKIIDTFIKGE